LLVLSPTPARRDQPAVIPPGEARGQFAISPQPNLSFPGTEPGTKAGAGGSTTGDAASTGKPVAALVNNPSANTTNSGVSSTSTGSNSSGSRPGPSSDVFPGITILGGVDDSRSPNSAAGNSRKGPPEPLQTSYGITILSSGGTGGGLPDFGVFGAKDQVQTVYLDMRRTILDDPISWTAEYGISQAIVTSTNERLTVVGSQAEILLPFPILKERPAIPAEVARKNPDRMVIAYAVISTDGTMEQVSIKQSPDPLLNEIVLDALRKWTFRPARRNGEVVPAKFLVGIPLRAQ
jgi:TonB family protein